MGYGTQETLKTILISDCVLRSTGQSRNAEDAYHKRGLLGAASINNSKKRYTTSKNEFSTNTQANFITKPIPPRFSPMESYNPKLIN
jgi:hypothetical protein